MLSLLLALLAGASHPGAPAMPGQCGWVHGRFGVYNGSGIQRIWIIGTHRIVALRDDDDALPASIRRYEASGPYVSPDDALFGDFLICARERQRPGVMQHVRIKATKKLIWRNKPFPPSP